MIHQVQIRNFRSITNKTIYLNDLTILVGKNDVGKSNYLRALNLFFNDETEPGQKINFKDDFSYDAKVPQKKAKEIIIKIFIDPPVTYSEKRKIVWTKVWRVSGIVENSKKFEDETEINDGRSKIVSWLENIRYKYVPAIKSSDYFSQLLSNLYEALEETVDTEIRDASGNFIKHIRDHTSDLEDELKKVLGFKSNIQIPNTINTLFKILDFETEHKQRSVSMANRGDGIKVRHIPAILKFISAQYNKNLSSGSIRRDTIWGYEEPENNLELSVANSLANDFLEYSKDIQILITTHSPAFYAMGKRDRKKVTLYQIKEYEESVYVLPKITPGDVNSIDRDLGLLEVLSPYIEEHVKEKEALAEKIKKYNKPVIYTEGETDPKYLKKVISLQKPNLADKVDIEWIGRKENGQAKSTGESHLKNATQFLKSNKEQYKDKKIMILFDNDVNIQEDKSSFPWVIKLATNKNNVKIKKGIENLLPDEMITHEFYVKSSSDNGAGKIVNIEELDKVKLCDSVVGRLNGSHDLSGFSNFIQNLSEFLES